MLLMGPARRNAAPVLTFLGGAALWGASLAGWFEPLPETVTSAAGSLTLAAALVWSARICQAGACEVCADDETTDQPLPPSGPRQPGRRRFLGSP